MANCNSLLCYQLLNTRPALQKPGFSAQPQTSWVNLGKLIMRNHCPMPQFPAPGNGARQSPVNGCAMTTYKISALGASTRQFLQKCSPLQSLEKAVLEFSQENSATIPLALRVPVRCLEDRWIYTLQRFAS